MAINQGERCQREAVLRATRPHEDTGEPVDLLLCREDYKARRVNGMVRQRRPI